VAEKQKDSKIGAFFKSILPSEKTVGSLLYTDGELDLKKLGGIFGAGAGALGLFDRNMPTVGYQGSIPEYTAIREPVSFTDDLNRRPGSGGRRYFSDVTYAPEGDTSAAQTAASEQALGLQALNLANPFRQDRPASVVPDVPVTQGIATATNTSTPTFTSPYAKELADAAASVMASSPYRMAAGGIAQLRKGRYLDGDTDGMADEVPAMIDNEQPAALSDGEFVIPADVVSHLGNGNSDAGAKELETMMDKVRMARTGTKKQAPAIDPEKFLPT
tara:strand:+ start:180 stop:1001 length:822 start_codon:yes stop_codon:yes gene_type:complete